MEHIFAKVENNEVTKWPLSYSDIMARHPGISFPSEGVATKTLATLGYKKINDTKPPVYDPNTHHLAQVTPFVGKNKQVYQRWELTNAVTNLANSQQCIPAQHHNPFVTISTGKCFRASLGDLSLMTNELVLMSALGHRETNWKLNDGVVKRVWMEELTEALKLGQELAKAQ